MQWKLVRIFLNFRRVANEEEGEDGEGKEEGEKEGEAKEEESLNT